MDIKYYRGVYCFSIMKKKRRRVRTRIKVIGVLLIGYVLFFIFTSMYYRDKWYPNTTIDGIDVSNLTYNETKEIIDNRLKDYSLEIKGKKDVSFKIEGADIDFKTSYEKSLDKGFSNHKDERSIFTLFANHDYEINFNVKYNKDKLNKIISNSVLVKGNEDYKISEATAAHIEYDSKTKSGKVVESTSGNELNLDEFTKIIEEALKNIQVEIDLSNEKEYSNVYEKVNNKNIDEQLETYNSYLLNWITWDMGEGVTEKITPDEIKEWINVNEETGKVSLDKDAMSEWIEAFCLKYKTVGKERNFTTHTGQVIKISGGDYGWRLDYDEIVEQVYEIITEKTDQKLIQAYIKDNSKENISKLTTELEPIYSSKGYKLDYENFENDWDTQNYSEIDITEQKVYVYRDGQLAYSCICVTGLPTEKQDRITRTGVWYIKEKRSEKVLVGEDYETPVKYWIRIMWTGTGYHALDRSDWDKWTPELYKTKGSHGCINLKEEDASKLYELIDSGDPVFIHY